MPSQSSSQFYLCGNCGTITPDERWTAWKRDDEGEAWLPAEQHDGDPMLRAPCCGEEFTDDDAGPALYGGSHAEMEAERADLLRCDDRQAEWWAEILEEVAQRAA